ncbi:MAG: hypothetical protein LV477_03495 [Candidatus Nitrosotalea sp.]|nr:hypothetical protein [Candidatus Nitrosotalea sp.]
METLHLSKFSIFMISIIVLAMSIYGIIVLTSPSTISSQNDRVYLHSSNSPGSSGNYVKISDMEPNSFGYFMYPNSYDFDSANAYQMFMLIRLPKIMGGDQNDTSSFRAYSALDPTSHCLMKYWPQPGRQRIEDPCISPPYRSIDGVSYSPGLVTIRAPVTGALPKLDLDVDSQGYLVVKPPVWEENKNGVVGIGRDVSKDQVLNSSRYLLEKYATQSKTPVPIPLSLEGGQFLIDMSSFSVNDTDFRYTWDRSHNNMPIIDTVYCNCTGLSPTDPDYDRMTKYMQAWQFGNHTVYSSATNVDGQANPTRFYSFEFYRNGYHVFFNSASSFDQGMNIILDSFFNGTKLSDIEQVPIGK